MSGIAATSSAVDLKRAPAAGPLQVAPRVVDSVRSAPEEPQEDVLDDVGGRALVHAVPRLDVALGFADILQDLGKRADRHACTFPEENPKVDPERRNSRCARTRRDGGGLERLPW